MSENKKDMCEYNNSTVKNRIEYSESDKQKLENMRKLRENIELYSTTQETKNAIKECDENYDEEYYNNSYTCPYCQAIHDSQYELEKCIKECQ